MSMVAGTLYNLDRGWHYGLSIVIAVLAFKLVQTLCDWYRERKYSQLVDRVLCMETSLVVRGDSKENISNWDLAVGDVIELKAGDKVPAHCVVIEGFNL